MFNRCSMFKAEHSHYKGSKIKEFQVVYHFAYIPGGLFNRMQVRLYNYADNSIIWKNGTLLKKNNHLALINQLKNSMITVKVQGSKPENIIFLIHEVIETLINDFFHGIKYDYSFPCPECVDAQAADPCLFSSSLLRRASDLKAPYLQCHKYFHAISIQEMMSMMPIDGVSTLDINLEYSLRDLKELKKNLKYDITFWYVQNDVPNSNEKSRIDPLRVLRDIESQDYKVWFSKDPANEKMDRVTYALKESKLVILCISDSFSNDEKSLQVYELVKNIIKKNYLLIEFGSIGERKWLENPLFAAICTDVRVIMQDPKRYPGKITEVIDSVERQIKDVRIDRSLQDNPPDVFISYTWGNSHDAVKKGTKHNKDSLGWLDPRSLKEFFHNHGINAWLDINELGTSSQSLFCEITKGLNLASVIICCFSDEYVKSQNCVLEFRFAHISLKLPIIKAIVGTGNDWRSTEVSFLSGGYPEVNFQAENADSYDKLLYLVQTELKKVEQKKLINSQNTKTKQNLISQNERLQADQNTAAFQELYELTQRKFLKQLARFAEQQQMPKKYPKLFCIDLIEKKTVESLLKSNQDTVDTEIEVEEDDQTNVDNKELFDKPGQVVDDAQVEYQLCLKPMCEFEEGWHLAQSFVLITELKTEWCSYLARIMNILKNDCLSNELNIFVTEQGRKFLKEIDSKSLNEEKDVIHSYHALRKYFIEQLESESIYSLINNSKTTFGTNLERCELKNGNIYWLCPDHVTLKNAKVLMDSVASQEINYDSNKYQILKEINEMNMEEILNERSSKESML